ncbi:MAG: adenylyltransferase/cytidyltransferase family protein, partial [Lachnospira sp.]|nr:adenylyltransferase/cytidyltransferase family protein [Lachnospira sp.]
TYDYIIALNIIEPDDNPTQLLKKIKSLLSPHGRLILGAQNRLAVKYFCGDRDPYTNHNFDGIDNYRSIIEADKKEIKGRCYAKNELSEMLNKAGLVHNKFYSVMPDLQETQLVYAEEYDPKEELSMRYFPMYNYPDSVFLDEAYLYTTLIKNNMFHTMANAFIIESSIDGTFDTTLHATVSMERGPENAMVTDIEMNNNLSVCKMPVYKEGLAKLKAMQDNLEELRARGIRVVDSYIDGNRFIMPYIDLPVAMIELKEVAKQNKDEFIKSMDALYELILQSSEHTTTISEKDKASANGRDLGPILSKGYIDMVALNCFYDSTRQNPKERFIFYDQEFFWENCPAKAILYRSIIIIYDSTDKEFEKLVPKEQLFERYGLTECMDIWPRMSSRFTDTLRNVDILEPYFRKKRCNARTTYTNREKINYSAKDYQRIFIDIFKGLDTASKKLVLFGSGQFTKNFIAQFGNNYKIYSIIDNNSDKWGTQIEGIPINPPDFLKSIPDKELHLIICIKKYYGVVKQLEQMGITDYHIFDPNNDYPNKSRENIYKRLAAADKEAQSDMTNVSDDTHKKSKPYNIGYIAGVFDLFHIGHLNMFKRAKEMCNYLIVGVVSDEGVRLNKQAEPFVPFEERIEMVRSCRYVDEAVKLPLDFAGTRDMFKIYHFDVQFSGSDYENNPYWLSEKAFLEENGSTMVFFPYTQSTSSTKLKKAIESRIADNN